MHNRDHCLNCGSSLTDGQNFCAGCGQRTSIHRLSLHEITHDAIHYFTHADKGIFSLLRELVMEPGKVAREYVEGKRVKYFKPLNFFLIVAGILVFMTSFFYSEDASRSKPFEERAAKAKNAEEREAYLQVAERVNNVNKFTGKYSNFIYMLATPLAVSLFWLFYRKDRFSYLEHLVANMYFLGFIMLAYALIVVPLINSIESPPADFFVLICFFVFEITYRAVGYYQFINRSGGWAKVKALGVSLLVSVLWFFIVSTFISIYIRTGFKGIFN
jgi:uncharacterized membrane protein